MLNVCAVAVILLKNDERKGLPFTPGKRLVVVGSDVNNLAAIMEPGNYNADNICPHGHPAAGAIGLRTGIDTSCLSNIWQTLNATNAKAGGTAELLDRSSRRRRQLRGGSGSPSEKWDNESIAEAVSAIASPSRLRSK